MLKEYVVCDEKINGQYGHYSIRTNIDCNPSRFKILASFNTFDIANAYVNYLRDLKNCFKKDE